MAVTDLTGTKWRCKSKNISSPYIPGGALFSVNATITDGTHTISKTGQIYASKTNYVGYIDFFTRNAGYPSFVIEANGVTSSGYSSITCRYYQSSSTYQATEFTVEFNSGTDVRNTSLIQMMLANAEQIPTTFSITYHSDGGTPTPENLTGQTALPDPLPIISKSNYIFNGWYLDSTFETPAVAGATISANTDLYAKFTEDTRIHCDLTQLAGWADLAVGQHTITVKAKASGYRDSEPSTGVTVTKAAAYDYEEDGNAVIIRNAPYTENDNEVIIT